MGDSNYQATKTSKLGLKHGGGEIVEVLLLKLDTAKLPGKIGRFIAQRLVHSHNQSKYVSCFSTNATTLPTCHGGFNLTLPLSVPPSTSFNDLAPAVLQTQSRRLCSLAIAISHPSCMLGRFWNRVLKLKMVALKKKKKKQERRRKKKNLMLLFRTILHHCVGALPWSKSLTAPPSERRNRVESQDMSELKSKFMQMLDYNVSQGKMNRGLSVIDVFKSLKEGKELSDDEVFLACALGWSIEWLQAYFLIQDDIMDQSHTRRGQPCWFRLSKVGMIAINDGLILRNQIFRILKRHFIGKPYYTDLLDLFNEVEFQTVSGEMIDLITTLEGEKDLSKYSLSTYRRIVACALLMAGENLVDHTGMKNVLVEMTIYHQVQDDFLDCFGDPEVTGKIGTDIEDSKCSWLVVKALERANDDQKKLLYENYGKANPACVAKVKELYKTLDIQDAFAEFESKNYEKITKQVEAHRCKAVQAIWRRYTHKRQKWRFELSKDEQTSD
ncbi:Farnesyl pyrophosphate synthase 2 [Hibiscus syriacus]|uniref:Farnesyl pyrophosphate synthase 2 n=1 Tax=Hibiscus syriacus TaxID=106335 RepID=A0A6A3AUK4_HIBSY|nr:Farnesyl pyrophosphate synthase 2 [Hibiscus syriacus]